MQQFDNAILTQIITLKKVKMWELLVNKWDAPNLTFK